MRVEFINLFGGKMYVDESRVDEYKRAGYKLALENPSEEDLPIVEEKPKRTRKKN